jgi:hypothetical protein
VQRCPFPPVAASRRDPGQAGKGTHRATPETIYGWAAAINLCGVALTGFNLGRGLAKRSGRQVRDLYADLAAKIRAGVLKAPIDSRHPIEAIGEALVRTQQDGRHGKVPALPNGPLQTRRGDARGRPKGACDGNSCWLD